MPTHLYPWRGKWQPTPVFLPGESHGGRSLVGYIPQGRKKKKKKVKEESEKVGLKLNIQKTKIMASSPITSWQIDGEMVETVADFIFLGSKIMQMVITAMKLKDAYCLEGKLWPI